MDIQKLREKSREALEAGNQFIKFMDEAEALVPKDDDKAMDKLDALMETDEEFIELQKGFKAIMDNLIG